MLRNILALNLLTVPLAPIPLDPLPAQSPLRRNTGPNLPKRRRRPPLLALPRTAPAGHLGIQLVDLLEGQALGLVDHEVDEGDAQEAASEPDEEDLGLQVGVAGAEVDEVGRRVGDGPVEEPVGCGGHGEGFGADFEGEDLARDDPGGVGCVRVRVMS